MAASSVLSREATEGAWGVRLRRTVSSWVSSVRFSSTRSMRFSTSKSRRTMGLRVCTTSRSGCMPANTSRHRRVIRYFDSAPW